ncbi:Crp/Fnr family transcriptional regulator [Flavobacterium sp.]|uniref:Crp/Fnr family transcriptional regulator n=1 Tax=Flavobacterium sp. TaxID=239 RepID=UPI003D13713A
MREEIKKYLNHIKETCAELSEKELLKFGEGLTITELKKNDLYIDEGQMQKQGGFLVKGLIRAFHTDNFGNEKNIYFIPENEYTFHYASIISQEPCPLTFQCLENSTIVNFSLDQLSNAYETLPKFEKYGRLILEVKLRNQQQRLESLLYKNAEQRYIDFINEFPQLFNRITVSELCSYLGVERQTLTRIRKKISQS